jgi:L-fucose isomerase-like protein
MAFDKYLHCCFKKEWKFQKQPGENTLETGIKYYLALKEKVQERGYEAISLIDVDGMKKLLNFPPSMIFMLLADDPGICTIPENDIPGEVTQLMVKYLTGQIGAYLEFYEFMEDRVLAGVPDYVPSEIVKGRVEVCPNSFGEFGESILNVSKIKTGKVTMCRLAGRGDKYRMHMVTGKAVDPRSWEEAGWAPPAPQLPSLEVILDNPVEEFAQKVMGQHYIVSYGDNTQIISELCHILGVEVL